MAEDGMLLNFDDVSVPPSSRTAKFKGGSWRDRARAQKSRRTTSDREPLRPRQQTHAGTTPQVSSITVVTQESGNSEQQPTKRRRLSKVDDSQTPENSVSLRGSHDRTHHPTRVQGKKEVVSSLFSYNPATSQSAQASISLQDEPAAQPTNAPLPNGTESFTGLGLSSSVSSHLTTKMALRSPTAIQKSAIPQLLESNGDAFIQSETGSGKTLAYLLPIVEKIISLSRLDPTNSSKEDAPVEKASKDDASKLQRQSGLFAIIVAPTRELCKQIYVVIERLLGCAHYIVAGNVLGGEKKKSEKARLRKGLNILVATPGRLADHLENTKVLDVSRVRWLVLDEGDRLMELGFEQEIAKIVTALDKAFREAANLKLPERRSTILCSATMKMSVQKLGEISLKDATLIRGETNIVEAQDVNGAIPPHVGSTEFLAPAQLKQAYMIVPSKQRLVTLIALLRRTFARKGSVQKAIVFVSCADSVEFLSKAFSRVDGKNETTKAASPESALSAPVSPDGTELLSTITSAPFLNPANSTPALHIHKLHGSLPQQTRTATIRSFAQSTKPSLLIATDVASRGLDLPNLDLVIEYDPAFSREDHLHRVGRTARLGRDGRAIIFLQPGSEESYIEVLQSSYRSGPDGIAGAVTQTSTNDTLKRGFLPLSGVITAQTQTWEDAATECQLGVERWVLSSPDNKELARRAFQSHVRAYATHTAAERKYFDMGELHLGHLAKAFGLRDAPSNINIRGTKKSSVDGRGAGRDARSAANSHRPSHSDDTTRNTTRDRTQQDAADSNEAAMKMRQTVRERNRNVMRMGGGAEEFNIA